MLSNPRIVLVAGSFPEPVTASVVWLCEQGLDIALVEVSAFRTEHDLVVSVSQIWPLPEIEEFTVGPRAGSAAASKRKRARSRSAVAILADQGAIDDGTELQLVPALWAADEVDKWIAEQPDRGKAVWRTGERVRALEWLVDGRRYSASNLAELIAKEATGWTVSLQGTAWWALADGTTLSDLAGVSSGRDWSGPYELLAGLQAGEWTTYGDLAEVIGSHPIAVGQHIARSVDCPNAWRVLGADGRPRPHFRWDDPDDTRSQREALEAEGVPFLTGGAADPQRRVTGDDLQTRLDQL